MLVSQQLITLLHCGFVAATVSTATFSKQCSNVTTSGTKQSSRGFNSASTRAKWRCLSDCAADKGCEGVVVNNLSPTLAPCRPLPLLGRDCRIKHHGDTVYKKQSYLAHICTGDSTYVPHLRVCYRLIPVTKGHSVSNVRDQCAAIEHHYHLVTITTAKQQVYMTTLLAGSTCDYVWTAGYTDVPGSPSITDWYWHLGDTTQRLADVQERGQMFWADDEPDNQSGDQRALMLCRFKGWTWCDMPDRPELHNAEYYNNFCALCQLN